MYLSEIMLRNLGIASAVPSVETSVLHATILVSELGQYGAQNQIWEIRFSHSGAIDLFVHELESQVSCIALRDNDIIVVAYIFTLSKDVF
jgi:hypothetical protein